MMRLAAALAVLALSAAPALAAPPQAVALSPQDAADLHRIETYLDGVSTLKADFEQTNQDGSTAEGTLDLSRPGKMRFEYKPPTKMFIVSNGDYVAVDDTELNQVQFYPVDDTPVWFLLREGVKLSGDVTVTKFERGPQSLRVTCVETKDAGSGSITLTFSDQPLTLRQWTVLDKEGHITQVALVNVETGVKLESSLFRLPAKEQHGIGAGDMH